MSAVGSAKEDGGSEKDRIIDNYLRNRRRPQTSKSGPQPPAPAPAPVLALAPPPNTTKHHHHHYHWHHHHHHHRHWRPLSHRNTLLPAVRTIHRVKINRDINTTPGKKARQVNKAPHAAPKEDKSTYLAAVDTAIAARTTTQPRKTAHTVLSTSSAMAAGAPASARWGGEEQTFRQKTHAPFRRRQGLPARSVAGRSTCLVAGHTLVGAGLEPTFRWSLFFAGGCLLWAGFRRVKILLKLEQRKKRRSGRQTS